MLNISRIVAATDFSPAGHAVLSRAGQLAARHGAELRLIHATPDWNMFSSRAPIPQSHYEEVTRNADVLMKREVHWLAQEFGAHTGGEVHRGRASQVIARAVQTYQPNLVVIGARGENAPKIAPAALGGTTLKLMTRITAPLLIVRESTNTPYSVSLAAVSNIGEQAERIVRWGTSLVHGGDCHIVRAYDVSYLERLRLCDLSANSIATCRADAERAVTEATTAKWPEDQNGAHVHVHLVPGTPLPCVLTEITRYSPQFITVGRHERMAYESEHTMLGCVATRLAYHAPVDVLIIP